MNHLTPEAMYKFVSENHSRVTCKKQSNGLHVLKYRNKVFYENLWTPELIECRGTVVEVDDERECLYVVQRPFTKIFNFNERGTRIARDTIVTAPRKINGFFAALTSYKGNPLVSTTGSCDSEYAKMAYDMLDQSGAFKLINEFGDWVTWCFEIAHPDDPHIYREEPGVYLIGSRRTTWDASQHFMNEIQLDKVAKSSGVDVRRPEWFRMRFGDLVQMNKHVPHEGFVCWTDDGVELKIKSPRYLASKLFARMNADKLVDMVMKSPHELRRRIDEEYYCLIDFVEQNVHEFTQADEQLRLLMIREFIDGGLTS